MRGADALVEGLVQGGVGSIFALSGNQIMPVFDALFDTDVRLIHTRHEAAAVYMAESYAQLTGQIGVALVTAGGGLGNASGALIAAQASDTPVLLLSGDSPVSADGCGAFQEMDQTAMTRGLTKASHRVMRADDVAQAVRWAVDLAQSGRPGPVHLALPADVLTAQTDIGAAPYSDTQRDKIALPDLGALAVAEHPLVVLGPALNETRAPGLAQALQDKLQAPVVAMESPRGMADPSLGRFAQAAQMVDHVVCIGKPVDFTLRFGQVDHWPNAKTWDIVLGDEAQIAVARGNLGPRLGKAMVTDPLAFATQLIEDVPPQRNRSDWLHRFQAQTKARVIRSATDAIVPVDICTAVQMAIDEANEPILISDGGEFGQWAQAFVAAPRRVINGVSGIIGGGLCYAIAAKAAHRDATVFALMGDGTVGFHLSEFETALRADLPFIAVIGNDKRWNAEHLIQSRSFGADRQIGCELSSARYDLAVAGLGGFGAYVTEIGQMADALNAAIESGLPACINVEMQGLAAPDA